MDVQNELRRPANEPFERTAVLRFSQFDARWPAATEFWCWMI